MSENLNRSTPDFSKYDSMSIGELEEILRADAQGPERDDSDVDEILYVMEVLAKKRRQNGIAGKTALEAYQEFQQHYLPKVEEESKPRHKINVILFRKIAAVAASLILVFSLTTTANAFSFKDVWDAVVTWAQETFCFSVGVKVSEPDIENELEYSSFQEALSWDSIDSSIIPSLIPTGYSLEEIIIDETPLQKTYLAIYRSGDKLLRICVQSFLGDHPEQIEINNDYSEIYTHLGCDYYLLVNNQLSQAVWMRDTYECYIAGEIAMEDLQIMIDSIGKG